MQFKDLACLFERLETISSRNEITQELADFFKVLSADEARVTAYLVLGEIGPVYEGLQFNLAEKSLLKMLASFYKKDFETVKSLLEQKGDIGSVVQLLGQEVEAQVGIAQVDYSLMGVYKFLRDLQVISGTGAQQKKEAFLAAFLKSGDDLSVKYLLRIILGNLRLGFSDMTLLDVFSYVEVGDKSLRPVFEQAYNVCVDVGIVIKKLKLDGVEGVKHISMTPSIPVRPSAAERLNNAQAIIEKLGSCVAQPKLDGFRLQVHVENFASQTQVHFFSRNMQDMSEMFPDLKALVLKLPVQSCIFEGEAIAFDQHTGAFLPFQETVKRKRKHDIDTVINEFPLKLYAFDLLFLNGESCLELTHHQRRLKLQEIVEKVSSDALVLIDECVVDTAEQLENYFYKNIEQGLEGLVVKRDDAVYMPGKRNFNWIKLKRQETGSLDDTIDCVILGYYKGSGKRAKFGMGALLVGVYDKQADSFETVAKIGTGMTDIEFVSLREACDELRVVHKPVNVVCSRELEPDVWVQPKLVCMIRADEITFSPAHKAAAGLLDRALALRFPRYMGLRPDKSGLDATTNEELVSLFKQQKIRKS